MAEALQGKNVVLLWRKLKEEALTPAKLMIFQTEHETSLSRDSDSTATKFGMIVKSGELEDEISFTSLVDKDDTIHEYLEEGIRDDEIMEVWEVDITEALESGKYPAWYRQGKITEFSKPANAEDLLEVSGTYVTNQKAQKGEATFTQEQMEAIQYAFKDTVQATEAVPGA